MHESSINFAIDGRVTDDFREIALTVSYSIRNHADIGGANSSLVEFSALYMDFQGWLLPAMIPELNNLIVNKMKSHGATYMVAEVSGLMGIALKVGDYVKADSREIFSEIPGFLGGIIVVNPDYILADRHKFPAQVQGTIKLRDGDRPTRLFTMLTFFASVVMQQRLSKSGRPFSILKSLGLADEWLIKQHTPELH